ncbi:hypothetical protein BU24DRAFT_228758 [Aaosphaeria arxii CBS 175.79]|uniref:Heterokaryon incompatibility domain-containing protein n=1 Tax=Aaosphaeria arxii CBS 175.79 TaxID=1450172 RepID=A0A6A5XQU2_9PLEO|nr:uncharacterized protein BU24DRAFT_228758 [Aaosphaeria arxii CBS 175.79]KAF2015131.1 hypothetical protein BU24DRAFT_228758 [Aaosphaeria arxii CBS 175.79]
MNPTTSDEVPEKSSAHDEQIEPEDQDAQRCCRLHSEDAAYIAQRESIDCCKHGKGETDDISSLSRNMNGMLLESETVEPLVYPHTSNALDSFRLLALHPEMGSPNSTVRCEFIVRSTNEDYCYLAIRGSRGHPSLVVDIVVNGQKLEVTKNIQVFLSTIRSKTHTRLLWIREICLNAANKEERNMAFTEQQENYIFAHSCRALDMNDFMDDAVYEEADRLSSQSAKLWREIPTDELQDDFHHPQHFPISVEGTSERGDLPLPYRYVPLDVVAGEIRLVLLPPAKQYSDPIKAYLAHERLNGPVRFLCLSYTWGSSQRDNEMLLNNQVMKITHNLDKALRDLRSYDNIGIVVWIDAICINQENTQEKSRQIPRMCSIYAKAFTVWMWLGEWSEDAETAISFIGAICAAPDWQKRTPAHGYQITYNPRICQGFASLYRLLTRPYFTRSWIVQEVAMSSNPTVVYGRQRISWFQLQQAASVIQVHWDGYARQDDFDKELPRSHEEVALRLSHVHRLHYHRSLQENGKRSSLLHLALSARSTACYDPRDKLYALWDLADDARLLGLKPDYTTPAFEVYMDFAQAYIEKHNSLDIICASQEFTIGLGTWTPEWRHPATMNPLIQHILPPTVRDSSTDTAPLDRALYCASRSTRPICTFPDKKTLSCAGMFIDKIDYVLEQKGQVDILDVLRCRDIARQWCRRYGKLMPEDEVDDQFWCMLMGEEPGAIRVETHPERNSVSFPGADDENMNYRERIYSMLRGRRVIFTKLGYMGLARADVVPGMDVCILLGCSVPVVLGACDDFFFFSGSIYVQGWMKGEMLASMGTDEEIQRRFHKEKPITIR